MMVRLRQVGLITLPITLLSNSSITRLVLMGITGMCPPDGIGPRSSWWEGCQAGVGGEGGTAAMSSR